MKNLPTEEYYTTIQMRIPLDLEKIVNICDPVYSFNAIMEKIDLRKYYAEKESIMGRPRYDPEKLLKVILFAFMENGYSSLRNMSSTSEETNTGEPKKYTNVSAVRDARTKTSVPKATVTERYD